MRKLLNTLYVTNPDVYIGLKGENIIIREDGDLIARFPLLNLESIVVFNHNGVSAPLMHACLEQNIGIHFLSETGYYLGSVCGYPNGNVLLRKQQVLNTINPQFCLHMAQVTIFAKLYNQKNIIERYLRQYPLRLDVNRFQDCSQKLSDFATQVIHSESSDEIRGIEGSAQVAYFNLWDELVLSNKENFKYEGRNRRPPEDPLNACLSFAYSLLATEVSNALITVGLDPYMGFFHTDRPGRKSLALDMMEEFRGVIADRFVLSLINRNQIGPKDFDYMESGAVLLKDDSRAKFLKEWHKNKQQKLTHPYLKEQMEWGLVPYAQALLLARYIRGDLDDYPAFCWK